MENYQYFIIMIYQKKNLFCFMFMFKYLEMRF